MANFYCKLKQLIFSGANHTEDLCALFKNSLGNQNLSEESEEGKVRKIMVQMWANFAKTK